MKEKIYLSSDHAGYEAKIETKNIIDIKTTKTQKIDILYIINKQFVQEDNKKEAKSNKGKYGYSHYTFFQ